VTIIEYGSKCFATEFMPEDIVIENMAVVKSLVSGDIIEYLSTETTKLGNKRKLSICGKIKFTGTFSGTIVQWISSNDAFFGYGMNFKVTIAPGALYLEASPQYLIPSYVLYNDNGYNDI
jgi:hypothetical protein